MLEYCPPGTVFTVMCIIVRTVEALGTAGYVTASFAILANTFPDKVATMMVSTVSSRKYEGFEYSLMSLESLHH